MAQYEMVFIDLPIGVPINECVELAKLYGTANSGSFINGALSAVTQERDSKPPVQGPRE